LVPVVVGHLDLDCMDPVSKKNKEGLDLLTWKQTDLLMESPGSADLSKYMWV